MFLVAEEIPVALSEIAKILVDNVENAFFRCILDMLPELQHFPCWETSFVHPINFLPSNPTAKPKTAPSAGIQCFLIFDCGAMS